MHISCREWPGLSNLHRVTNTHLQLPESPNLTPVQTPSCCSRPVVAILTLWIAPTVTRSPHAVFTYNLFTKAVMEVTSSVNLWKNSQAHRDDRALGASPTLCSLLSFTQIKTGHRAGERQYQCCRMVESGMEVGGGGHGNKKTLRQRGMASGETKGKLTSRSFSWASARAACFS